MVFKTDKLISSMAAALLGVALAFPATADDTAKIKDRLKQLVTGDVSKVKISKTPIQGLYQAQLGLTVVYMSEDGNYLLNGNFLDLKQDKNLTKEAQSSVRKQVLATMDESDMIVYRAKKPKHTITVFTDVDCPYCKKLHKEIPALNEAGVNVRYVAYPRAGIRDRRTGNLTASYQEMVSIWCAKDKEKAMDDAMIGITPDKNSCSNPVQQHMMGAQRMEVNGTPNIIFENGELYPGYVPSKELIVRLNKAS